MGKMPASWFGEIDIIAADRHYVVFVEVKLRASDRFVRAGAYVTPAKQARIRTAASLWLAEHDPFCGAFPVCMRSPLNLRAPLIIAQMFH